MRRSGRIWNRRDDGPQDIGEAIKAAKRLRKRYPESDVFDRAIVELKKGEDI